MDVLPVRAGACGSRAATGCVDHGSSCGFPFWFTVQNPQRPSPPSSPDGDDERQRSWPSHCGFELGHAALLRAPSPSPFPTRLAGDVARDSDSVRIN